MGERHLFTSESVSEGHPDKVADQISDAILDAILAKDPNARVACETSVTTGLVLVFGEISTTAYVDIQKVVRQTIKEIGYTRAKFGFDGDTVAVLAAIDEQSPDIAQGVDEALEIRDEAKRDVLDEIGAGDQGLMFGFAVDETPELMPLPIALSHRLVRRLADLRKSNELTYLRPDAKSQVTVEYDDNGQPERVDTIVISTQHDDAVDNETIRHDVIEKVIKEVIPAELLDDNTKYYINPTGRFVIAKNIVAAGLARKAEVQLAYAIGVAQPVSISINTFGTSTVPEEDLIAAVRENFDLRPAGIIEMLDLRRPIYRQTAAYGHFGRTDIELPWEKTDKVDAIKASLAK